MKQIKLTQGYVALVDDADYERVNAFKWRAHIVTRKDGSIRNVYAICSLPRINRMRTQRMHRFILGVTDSAVEVDHEDHAGLNNQRHNLRKATHAQNQHNTRPRADNTSGYKGVHWHKGAEKWQARIAVDGKSKSLGLFIRKEDAKLAYDAAAIEYHGQFACTNESLGLLQ